jgi:hypothetical protein
VIRVNFFSENCTTLANELHLTLQDLMDADMGVTEKIRFQRCSMKATFAIDYLKNSYGINKQLWIDSFRIFKYADNAYIKPKPFNRKNIKDELAISFEKN